jgi:predicted RNA binding protein YcfA (HicA-like mRNA interferase family)
MTRHDKLLTRILSKRSDSNIRFDDLRTLLIRLGFQERSRGSHHMFVKEGVRELINLQREGHLAKPYQVRQIRTIIAEYGLGEEKDD